MSKYVDAIIGHAVGDAMGVPVEFCIREKLMENPVTEMFGYGSHPVPAGYWSDDTSMEIATIDSFIKKGDFDYDDIMNNFVNWIQYGEYTPDGNVFDIGRTCLKAIRKYSSEKINPIDCGQKDILGNGNGSLMRMLPVALYCYSKRLDDNEIITLVNDISSLTHGHEISHLGCYIYTRYIMYLLEHFSKEESYKKIKQLDYSCYSKETVKVYDRILVDDIRIYDINEIKSSAYIVDTLEASLWVFLNCSSYKQTIIGAINLGNDTDTIGAIAGSMAGITYGFDNIPANWINKLAKKEYLVELATKFEQTVKTQNL